MSDNWEGDRDLDEYKGQDWRGSVFEGKHGHDGKYRGVRSSKGSKKSSSSKKTSSSGGGKSSGGKNYGNSYSNSGNSKKKSITISVIVIAILIFGYFFYTSGYEINLSEYTEKLKQVEKTIQSTQTSPLLDILNSQKEMSISNCLAKSDTKENVIVYCGDFGSASFISEIPIKSSINQNSKVSQKNGEYLLLLSTGQTQSYVIHPQKSLDVINEIESISKEIYDFKFDTDFIPTINIPEINWESIKVVTAPIESELKDIVENVKIATTPISPIESSKNAIAYINEIRTEKGRSVISFDDRAYSLALARVRDTIEYDYFDHTNPFTGSCPDNMKSGFGFSSNEYAAENLSGGTYGSISAIDLWMTSQGHRYNLLFTDHTSGAVACEGGNCVFLGVNNNHFGEGCYTGAEGEAWHQSMGTCSDSDFAKLDKLNEQYDSLSLEYDKYPQMSRSQSEYQQAMKLYNELQTLYNQIENFKC